MIQRKVIGNMMRRWKRWFTDTQSPFTSGRGFQPFPLMPSFKVNYDVDDDNDNDDNDSDNFLDRFSLS